MADAKHSALIGYTGTVGRALMAQASFAGLYRSSNVCRLDERPYSTIYCAGAPGTKWLANANPVADRQSIDSLIHSLERAKSMSCILFSTVDVFTRSVGQTENSKADATEAYGRHRADLEAFVRQRFERSLIIRMPALVGHTLKKNAIFDLKRGHDCSSLNPGSKYQFYPLTRLFADTARAFKIGLKTLHLSVHPIRLGDLATQIFGLTLSRHTSSSPSFYDMHSNYSEEFGLKGSPYLVSKTESLAAISAYADTVSPAVRT